MRAERTWQVGDRVVVPDPQAINPLSPQPAPHGPGEVLEVIPHPYDRKDDPQPPLLRVRLDSGGERRIGSLFVERER